MVKRTSIDHVTTVVADLDAATSALQSVFGCAPTTESRVPGMLVRTFRLGNAEIHVSAPSGPGPAEDFLKTRGGGLHHLAVSFDDLDAAIASLGALGVRTLGEPFENVPGVREVFLDPATTAGVLIQAVERRGASALDAADSQRDGGERDR